MPSWRSSSPAWRTLVRCMLHSVSYQWFFTLVPVSPGTIQELQAEVLTMMKLRGTIPHDAWSVWTHVFVWLPVRFWGIWEVALQGFACIACCCEWQLEPAILRYTGSVCSMQIAWYTMSSQALHIYSHHWLSHVFSSIHEAWCHLSAAGDAQPVAWPASHTTPTTCWLGCCILWAPIGLGTAAEPQPQARGPGCGQGVCWAWLWVPDHALGC